MKTLLPKALVALALALAVVYAQRAEDKPIETKAAADLRVIKTQKGFSTLIEFPADQKIREVTCGDKDSWVIEGSGRFLHVKPGKEGIITNIHVVMDDDQTVYSFVLREVTGPHGVSGKADLEVIVNPDQTIAELTSKLEESNETTAIAADALKTALTTIDQLQQKLTQTQQALNDVNEKYRTLTGDGGTGVASVVSSQPTVEIITHGPDGRSYSDKKYCAAWVTTRTETSTGVRTSK